MCAGRNIGRRKKKKDLFQYSGIHNLLTYVAKLIESVLVVTAIVVDVAEEYGPCPVRILSPADHRSQSEPKYNIQKLTAKE
jgi:hypothetical protein